MKKIIILAVIIVVLIIIGTFFIIKNSPEAIDLVDQNKTEVEGEGEDSQDEVDKTKTLIGKSVENREIVAYHYGNLDGEKEIMFIGGIYGGYSWNTVLVARELMNFLKNNSESIPENMKVTVVPILNPDGLNKVAGTIENFSKDDISTNQEETIKGRFNSNNVDLNRNFDCDWAPTSKWQNQTVSGGNNEFSEPESRAIKSYVENNNPDAIVTWYSSAGGVFASSCHNDISTETRAITNIYADASGYKAYEEFDFYEINGDMVNWFAKQNIPAISVLLTNHQDTEWGKNQKGIEALFKYYSE